MDKNGLRLDPEKLHTTAMGVERIKRNLQIDAADVVRYCRDRIECADFTVERKGKNWYLYFQDITLTVHARSHTIITAHRKKK